MNPFIGLIAQRVPQLPAGQSVTVAVDGRAVTPEAVRAASDPDEKAQLRRARQLAYFRERYARLKDDPEYKAKAKAYRERNREARREYKRKYDAENREAILARYYAWYRERYHSDPEFRQRALDARRRRYAAKRAAKLAQQQQQSQP